MPIHSRKKIHEKKAQEYIRLINHALRVDLPNRQKPAMTTIFMLLSTMEEKVLKIFMEKTSYHIFKLSLENRNLPLLNILFNKIRSEDHFLMIEYNDYEYLKQFISSFLESKCESHESSILKKEILFKLIEVDPKLIIQTLFKYLDEVENNYQADDQKKIILSLKTILSDANKFFIDKEIPTASTAFKTGNDEEEKLQENQNNNLLLRH